MSFYHTCCPSQQGVSKQEDGAAERRSAEGPGAERGGAHAHRRQRLGGLDDSTVPLDGEDQLANWVRDNGVVGDSLSENTNGVECVGAHAHCGERLGGLDDSTVPLDGEGDGSKGQKWGP